MALFGVDPNSSNCKTILDYNPYSLPSVEGEATVLGRECS